MFKQTCNYITHPSGKVEVLYQAWSNEAVFQDGCWKPQILAITAKLVIGAHRRVLLASHGVLNYTWLQHCWNTNLFLFCSLQWTRGGFFCFDLWNRSVNIDSKICLHSIFWIQLFLSVCVCGIPIWDPIYTKTQACMLPSGLHTRS